MQRSQPRAWLAARIVFHVSSRRTQFDPTATVWVETYLGQIRHYVWMLAILFGLE
jgi:hypothetical protein